MAKLAASATVRFGFGHGEISPEIKSRILEPKAVCQSLKAVPDLSEFKVVVSASSSLLGIFVDPCCLVQEF